jgi:protein involved in polysaccharide export with SLBB domain
VGLAACVVVTLAVGCGRTLDPVVNETWSFRESPLRLVPGDSVEIKFYRAPELNDTQTIRPDGMVSLELVGEVKAAGKTPAELARRLETAYAGQLVDASAIVIVRSFGERRVLVAGAVENPGPVAMPGRMTALEAVLLAGGFDAKTAETRSVLLIRHGADGVYRGRRLDLKRAIGGRETPAVRLKPLDILFVPRTRIVKVNQWISQHVSGLIPRLGLVYTRRTSDTESFGINIDGGD